MANRVKHEPVGYNQRTTPYKQFALDRALGHLLGSSAAVARQRQAPCIVGDMTAGPGHDQSGQPGSPLIIAKHLNNLIERGYHPTLICVEQEEDRLEYLHTLLTSRYPNLPVEYFTSQADALTSIPRNAVGLTYWDPTKYTNLDTGLLTRFGNSHYFMDILITRECLATKRMQNAAHCPGTLTIQEYLALTGKKCNSLLMYAKYNWWTFGFASNWIGRNVRALPEFRDMDSPQAREWYSKWTADVELEPEPVAAKEQSLW